MRRLICYVVVGLVTFEAGIAVSGVGDLLSSRNSEVAGSTKTQTSSLRITANAPALSIDRHAGQPLRLLYGSTEAKAGASGTVQVTFFLQNSSEKTIRTYAVEYRSKSGSGFGLLTEISKTLELNPGKSDSFIVETHSDSSLSLAVKSVVFEDGTGWSATQASNALYP